MKKEILKKHLQSFSGTISQQLSLGAVFHLTMSLSDLVLPARSPSGQARGSRDNIALFFELDSRIKSENDSRGGENDRKEKVLENDSLWIGKCLMKNRDGGLCKAIATAMVLCSILLFCGVANATCYNKSCTELGYTQSLSECDENFDIIKCPFDTSKVFCETKEIKCTPGDIYYSDGTCDASVVSGKTEVGVVGYVTDGGKHGGMLALEEMNSLKWGLKNDLSCLPNITSTEGAAADMNGKSNTSCIMSETSSGNTYPAAEYCNGYKPVSSGKGSSGWYLPSVGELKMISPYYSALNISLQRLSKTQLSSNWHWSSSEYDNDYAWVVRPSDGNIDWYGKYTYPGHVRCVLAF